MRRGLSIVLVGLGVFLLALAVLLRLYVVPNLLVTPVNQFAQSFAPGTGTVFNPATVQEEQGVHMVAHRTLRGDVAASSHDVGVWDESLLLERTDGSLINASTDRVAWDRKTGEAVNCCGEAVDGTPTKHKGLSYKFPFHTEKTTYQFFDTTAKKAYPMQYKGSERLQGLTVYRFEQTVAPVQIGQQEVPGSLVGESAPSVVVPRFYNNVRTVWVEPLTGIIIKGAEAQHQVFHNAAGADAVTLIDVTLTFDQRTQKQQAKLSNYGRSKAVLVSLWAPLGLGVLGLVLLCIGLGLAWRGGDDGAAPGSGSRRREPVSV
jgi:hypothetical protein